VIVIYGRIDLHLPYSQSLKHKRQVIKSISDRIRKRFNISIAEVAGQDLWQSSTLGFSAVVSSYAETQRVVQALQETLDMHEEEALVVSFEFEYALPGL